MLSPNQTRSKGWMTLFLGVLVVLALVAAGALILLPFSPLNAANRKNTLADQSSSNGIGVTPKANNESIGLSDGTYAFDIGGTNRVDGELKQQAADLLKKGDKAGATSLWNRAVGNAGNDTSDAEALIYLEDQQVLASGKPYVTLVVGTALTGNSSDVGTGRDNLQGAYVAQKEYNDGLKLSKDTRVRLLIANAGSSPDYVPEVAQRIVQVAQKEHIVGVIGWPFSAYAHKAIPVLAKANIPMVSQTASADDLSGISNFFFRVAPANDAQAVAAANYAKSQLRARRVALFVDPKNSYSASLANDFKNHFVTGNNIIVDTEQYTVHKQQQDLPNLLQKSLSFNPDLIYFAGYSDDLTVLLVNLPTSQPNLQVMGGDALYQLNGYSTSARGGFSRLHFTAFAYPDEWDFLNMSSEKPSFFSEYPAAFNPKGQEPGGKYGYTRADNDVILSYDATLALLQGCKNVLDASNNTVTSTALRDGLAQITSSNPVPGVSGQIAFGSDGNPVNKAIVVLYVDPDGHIKLLSSNGIQGCFRVCG